MSQAEFTLQFLVVALNGNRYGGPTSYAA